ncbi:MAG: ABC transporter substrate-binding protein, partial [Actinomycetota bacterium]|nr:ABC transporter substrate-binding protein [Actinomycetota bacterium]
MNATWRRRRAILVLATATALVGAACGGDAPDAPDDAQSPTAAPEDLSGQSIEVAAKWSGTEEGGEQFNFEQVIALFEEQTGADVTYTSTGEEIASVLGTRVEGGEPPDVAILPNPGLMKDLADQGSLQPVEDVAGSVVDANFAPVWRELGSVDGELYGVWFKAANKSTVWYNVNVFNDAGVTPPEDWEGMLQAGQTISDFGITPFSIGGADGWTLTDWFENIYLRTAGPEMYDQLTEHAIPWTDESVQEALTVFAEVVGNPDLIVGGPSGALNTDFPGSVTQVFTDPPDGAIVYEGDFVAGVIAGDTEAEVGTDADFFPFPSIEGSPPAVVGGGDVAVLMTDSEAGQAFVRFLATPEAAEVWAALGGFSSPNTQVDPGVYPDPVSARSAEALAAAETFRFDMSDLVPSEFGGTPGQGMWGILQDFLRTPDDVEGTAEQLEEAAAQAYG